MSRKVKQTSVPGNVQVFELTMNNPEDQDELNRRLRKPGEQVCQSTARGDTTAEPSGKKKGKGKKSPS